MTVANEVFFSGPYTGNGVTTVFAYGFKVFDQSHLRPVVTLANGTTVNLTITTHYTVQNVGAQSGTITLTPAGLAIFVAGATLLIEPVPPFVQPQKWNNLGRFLPKTIEDGFDRVVLQMQRTWREVLKRDIAIQAETSDRIAADSAESAARIAADAAESVARIAADNALNDHLSGVEHLESFCGAHTVAPTTRRDGAALQVGDTYYYLAGPELRYWTGSEWRSGTLPNSSPTAQIASDPVVMTVTGTVNAIVAGYTGGLGSGDKIVTIPSAGYNTGPVTLAFDGAAALALTNFAGNPLYAGQTGSSGYPMQVLRRGSSLRLLNPSAPAPYLSLAFDGVGPGPLIYQSTGCPYSGSVTRRVTLANHGYQVGWIVYLGGAVAKHAMISAIIDANTFELLSHPSGAGATVDLYRQPLKFTSGNVHSVVKSQFAGQYYVNLRQPLDMDAVALFASGHHALSTDVVTVNAGFDTLSPAGLKNTIHLTSRINGTPALVNHISIEARG